MTGTTVKNVILVTVFVTAAWLFSVSIAFVDLYPVTNKQGEFGILHMVALSLSALITCMLWLIFELRAQQQRAHRNAAQLAFAHSQLKIADNRIRTVIEHAPSAIVIKDLQGRFQFVNPIFCSWYATSQADLIGRATADFLAPPQSDRVAAHERHVLQSNQIVEEERQMVYPDGKTRDILVQKFPIPGPDNIPTSLGTIVTEISESKKLERLKSEFISTVSHELRTPLTAIKGSLGLIEAGTFGPIPDPVAELVALANNNSTRLIHLVNDILDTEKLDSGGMVFDFGSLDLAQLAAHVVADCQGLESQYRVTFNLLRPDTEVMVKGDANRLTQVIANLISNAAKFSSPEAKIEICVVAHGDKARVTVQDWGMGISDDFKDQVFERFTQANATDNRQSNGTGLGLSISKTIIERHNGQMSFTSALGKGSTFSFVIPCS